MPFDGSGNYVPPSAPAFPAVAGTNIVASYYNQVINDIVTALNNVLTRDGQGKPSAAISFNGQNLSNVGTLGAASAGFSGNVTVGGTAIISGLITAAAGLTISGGTLTTTSPIGTTYGGTGLDAHLAANGALLIGNGSGFALATLTAGAGISITNAAGSITIAATGGGGAGTTSFALTADNSGSGMASGGTFNGSAAKTISWNTIGAQPLVPQVQALASSATVTPTTGNDMVSVTALATNVTIANPTGTPNDGQGVVVRIKDNGTARTIGFGTIYRAVGVTLPTTTVVGKWVYIGMVYNATDVKWDVISVVQQ